MVFVVVCVSLLSSLNNAPLVHLGGGGGGGGGGGYMLIYVKRDRRTAP